MAPLRIWRGGTRADGGGLGRWEVLTEKANCP